MDVELQGISLEDRTRKLIREPIREKIHMDRLANNSKEPSVNLRPFGSAFLEKEFQYGYLSDSIEMIRVSLFLLLVLCLLAGFGDDSGSVEVSQYMPLLGIALAIVLIILLSIAYTEFFIRHYCLIISFVLCLASIGIPYCFFELYIQSGGDKGFMMVVMTVLVFWVYEFSRLGLLRSLQWGCLISMVYMAIATLFIQADQVNLLLNMIILIIVNVAGMTYSYENERYARLLFYEKLSINKLF